MSTQQAGNSPWGTEGSPSQAMSHPSYAVESLLGVAIACFVLFLPAGLWGWVAGGGDNSDPLPPGMVVAVGLGLPIFGGLAGLLVGYRQRAVLERNGFAIGWETATAFGYLLMGVFVWLAWLLSSLAMGSTSMDFSTPLASLLLAALGAVAGAIVGWAQQGALALVSSRGTSTWILVSALAGALGVLTTIFVLVVALNPYGPLVGWVAATLARVPTMNALLQEAGL